MRLVSIVSFILVIVGALNWLLVGAAKFDLVRWLVGRRNSVAGRIIYGLVGLAGITQVATAMARRSHHGGMLRPSHG